MKIQPIISFGTGVTAFALGKPFLFRAPSYVGPQKEISDTYIEQLSTHIDKKIIIANQTHGSDTILVDTSNRDGIHQGDALITQLRDICICVIASDCVPIVLYDSETKSIGVIHAGRKGLELGVIPQCIRSMSASFGAQNHTIFAYIGACISQDKYELGSEEVDFFQKYYPSHIKKSINTPYKYSLDVGAIAFSQLQQSGIRSEKITLSGECTYTESEKYHSYRRNTHNPETGYGNNIFGICLS